MYSRQERSQLRKNFWTTFGQYLRPLTGAEGEQVNWLNYKTGIKGLFFRMDAEENGARISIELRQQDILTRQNYFHQFETLRSVLEGCTGEEWEWALDVTDDDGNQVSRVSTSITGVNVFRQSDWPAIISFLKPRMLALDEFWSQAKESFT